MRPHLTRIFLLFSLTVSARAGERIGTDVPSEAHNLPANSVQQVAPPVKIDLNIAAVGGNVLQPAQGVETISEAKVPVLEPAAGLVQEVKPKADDVAGKPIGWTKPDGTIVDFAQNAALPADQQVLSGREQFDRQSSKFSLSTAIPSVRRWVSDLWKGADRVPAWPGKAGDAVKIDGKTYVLESRVGEGNSAIVWRATGGWRGTAVKFIHPEFESIPQYGQEVLALEALARTDIPHAKLLAKSADGLVVVKELVNGETAADLLARGGLLEKQRYGFAELAAKLIRIGYTADIHPNNLRWDSYESTYKLVDAGGFEFGRPWAVLKQILDGAAVKSGNLKAVEFLSGLRGRLGPDSESWKRVLADAAQNPKLAGYLAELSGHDRSLKSAPRPRLGSIAADPVLSDSKVKASEVYKRLGYDPLSVKPRWMLHGDDPGKLNTQVFRIEPKGRPQAVVKIAQWDIIRNELAMRKIIRRFFGTMFRTPASLAVENGMDSYMVMTNAEGSPSFASDPMDLEHRAALALIGVTFNLSDANQGNVLARSKSDVFLIDFEGAFGRRKPNFTRVPHEGIAEELPWVSRFEVNRVEDYFPAIREWRALFLKPETQAEIAKMLRESGFSEAEIAYEMAAMKANVNDLEWVVQNDVEFANLFAERRSSRK